ncbi:MAG TPA: cupredoxin domain-containing protein [Nitrosopumilaceae archaeon]|nr:cupredoxin domain-containing protein [Nitrosopumilaceae archaeon]
MENTKIVIAIAVSAVVIALVALIITYESQAQSNFHYTGVKREYWLFNSHIPDFNETKMGMPRDVYSMPSITVNKGDTIVIHFFNTESEGGDHHSFTISDNAYNINVALSPGENKTMTFNANTAGIFPFICTFHKPTMKGQLIVELPTGNQ